MGHPPEILSSGLSALLPDRRQRFHVEPGVWTLHFFAYASEYWVDDIPLSFREGTALVTAPDHDQTFIPAKPTEHLFVLFKLRPSPERLRLPAIHQLGGLFPHFFQRAREAVGFMSHSRRQAEARLWDILWELGVVSRDSGFNQTLPSVVSGILNAIEQRIHENLSVTLLAKEAGISHNHLTRLFKKHMGTTPEKYLCQRRTQKARHLLYHTRWPVKAIASAVGLPDLHAFNKVIRRELGASPRAIRQGTSSVSKI